MFGEVLWNCGTSLPRTPGGSVTRLRLVSSRPPPLLRHSTCQFSAWSPGGIPRPVGKKEHLTQS